MYLTYKMAYLIYNPFFVFNLTINSSMTLWYIAQNRIKIIIGSKTHSLNCRDHAVNIIFWLLRMIYDPLSIPILWGPLSCNILLLFLLFQVFPEWILCISTAHAGLGSTTVWLMRAMPLLHYHGYYSRTNLPGCNDLPSFFKRCSYLRLYNTSWSPWTMFMLAEAYHIVCSSGVEDWSQTTDEKTAFFIREEMKWARIDDCIKGSS